LRLGNQLWIILHRNKFMNRKTFAIAAASIFAFATFFTACKKSDDAETNSTKIIGTWMRNYEAVDANSNNAIDVSEKVAVPAGDYEYITFYNNNTLKDSIKLSGLSGTIPGTWSISGDYVIIMALGDTASGKLTQLDNTTLIIQDTAAATKHWTGYSKQ
jgi:hypothetical protein